MRKIWKLTQFNWIPKWHYSLHIYNLCNNNNNNNVIWCNNVIAFISAMIGGTEYTTAGLTLILPHYNANRSNWEGVECLDRIPISMAMHSLALDFRVLGLDIWVFLLASHDWRHLMNLSYGLWIPCNPIKCWSWNYITMPWSMKIHRHMLIINQLVKCSWE